MLQGIEVLEMEPTYGHIFDAMHAIEKQVTGAKLVVRPPPGVSAEKLTRILQCHGVRIVLGKENPAANDPYWLPDAWVAIDVKPDDGNFAVILSSDSVHYNLQLLDRAKHYADEHKVLAQSSP